MRQCLLLGALAIVVLGLCSAASADMVTSSDFTFAFSMLNPGHWGLEPTGGSSDYTVGDFTLTPAPAGSYFSGHGPTFPSRVLTDNHSGYSGDTSDFSLPITANYNGAALGSGYQLTIELTNLSIYGVAYNAASDLAFQETTAGHSATSPAVSLLNGGGDIDFLTVASNYTQLVWNPDDYAVSLATVNDPVTRTFVIPTSTLMAVDGLEVMGRVRLDYVPEPSAIVLLSAGMLSLLAYAWKKRR